MKKKNLCSGYPGHKHEPTEMIKGGKGNLITLTCPVCKCTTYPNLFIGFFGATVPRGKKK
jgi:hypothetical protein